jgi:hypothetical protein
VCQIKSHFSIVCRFSLFSLSLLSDPSVMSKKDFAQGFNVLAG